MLGCTAYDTKQYILALLTILLSSRKIITGVKGLDQKIRPSFLPEKLEKMDACVVPRRKNVKIVKN